MDDELKRLIRLLLNKAATVNGAPTNETFVNTTDSLEAVSDNIGQQDAAATSDDLSDVTTTAAMAKIRLILNRLSSDAFTATIQGAARTALDTMLAQLATYIASGGAALSIQVNGNAARDNLEQAIEDLTAVLGADGANVFNPSIGGVARTDLDAALTALGAASDVGERVLEVSITSAANAGNITVATITDQPCLIESVVIHADAAQTADMTTCAVYGGAANVVTFVSTALATQANLNATDKQVAWDGAVRLAATKTIVIDLLGTGATAVDLTVTIKYRPCVAGGYLS